jgi:N utilization substance protein B
LEVGEKELLFSIQKIHELYHLLFLLPSEFIYLNKQQIENSKQKYFPTEEEKNPNFKFINNPIIKLLMANSDLNIAISTRKLNWSSERDWLIKVFNDIKKDQEYRKYLFSSENSLEADKDILNYIFKNYIAPNEQLQETLEEKSIFWADDFELVLTLIIKTLKGSDEEKINLLPLYNDEDDKQFILELYRKTIIHNKEFEEIISKKTSNWEVERIAIIDNILMKMAITELIYFPSIPVKVTLNEYIDISKEFSTPKSKIFINGILDKIFAELKSENKINKTGRGLLE